MIVFGSFAHGDITSSSDLDLIAVMPSTRSGKDWISKIYDEVDRNVDCDILAYTREEIDKMLPISGILRSALDTGRTVYEALSAGILYTRQWPGYLFVSSSVCHRSMCHSWVRR